MFTFLEQLKEMLIFLDLKRFQLKDTLYHEKKIQQAYLSRMIRDLVLEESAYFKNN